MQSLLLVNPNNRIRRLGDLPGIEPPLWLLLMAAHYLEDGADVRVLDAEAENLSLEETVKQIEESTARDVVLVVMGNNPSVSSTPKMPIADELLGMLERDNVWVTGLHPMAVGHEKLLTWRPTKCLPLPWHLLDMSLYRTHNWHCLDGSPRQPYASIYTSLGCPYDCYYCNIHTLYQSKELFSRGVRSIIDEVETLVDKYQVRNIKIWDELFALSEKRVSEVCTALANYDLHMWAYARVDKVSQRMLEAMKKAGINWLAYGFENVSSEVRARANKNFRMTATTEDVIRFTRQAGINIIGNFMFGLPGETEQTAQDTLNWAKENLFEFVNFYVALPYPGSKWYQDTQPDMRWSEFNQYHPSSNPWFAFKEKAFREYFTNPDYTDMIKERFGEQGVRQINSMLQYKIGVENAEILETKVENL